MADYKNDAKLEPPDGMVLHGLGHYLLDDKDYTDTLGDDDGGGGTGTYLPLEVAVAKPMPSDVQQWANLTTVSTFSVPFPKGLVAVASGRPEAELVGPTKWQARVLAKWTDGSAKWAIFRAFHNPSTTPTITVRAGGTGVSAGSNLISLSSGVYTLATGAVTATVKTTGFNLFDTVVAGGTTVVATGTSPGIRGRNFADTDNLISSTSVTGSIEENGPTYAVLRIDGNLVLQASPSTVVAAYTCRFTVMTGSTDIKVTFTIRNATAARHDHLRLGWVELHSLIIPGATPRVICCDPTAETELELGTVSDVHCYQKYSSALAVTTDGLSTGNYKPHIPKVTDEATFSQIGWVKYHGTTLVTDTASADSYPKHGYMNLSGAAAGCTISIRHMPYYWPASLGANVDGTVRVGLFTRYLQDEVDGTPIARPYTIPWRMHESRECVFSFHRGRGANLGTPLKALQVAKRLDYPLYGRLAMYDKYDDSAVLDYRTVSLQDQRKAYQAMGIEDAPGNPHTPVCPNIPLTVTRFRPSSESGGENNSPAGETRIMDEYLRYGNGGALFRALDEAIYRAEWAIQRADDFVEADAATASTPGISHTDQTFDIQNNWQHLYHDGLIAAYYMTGDQRLYEGLLDDVDVLTESDLGDVIDNERTAYQWMRGVTKLVEFFDEWAPSPASDLLDVLKEFLENFSGNTVDVDAVSSGVGWDDAIPGDGVRGYYADSSQYGGDKVGGEDFVTRGFITSRLGPIAFFMVQKYLTTQDTHGAIARGRKMDLAKYTKNEVLAVGNPAQLPASLVGQKLLNYYYQIQGKVPGTSSAEHPGGMQTPIEHTVCVAAAEGFKETGDPTYLQAGTDHLLAFKAFGAILNADSGLEVQHFCKLVLLFLEPEAAPEGAVILPGSATFNVNVGPFDPGRPFQSVAVMRATLEGIRATGAIPNMGIMMYDAENPPPGGGVGGGQHIGVDDQVADGDWDWQVEAIREAIVMYGGPLFVAIGGECNTADKYHDEEGHDDKSVFVNAWEHVRLGLLDQDELVVDYTDYDTAPEYILNEHVPDISAEQLVTVAFVWGVEASNGNWADFKPTKSQIDWYDIHVFAAPEYLTPSPGTTQYDRILTFLAESVTDSKPVMVRECGCVGTQVPPSGTIPPEGGPVPQPLGLAVWNQWFVPFFQGLLMGPAFDKIKAIYYVTHDHTGESASSPTSWKNASLIVNETVRTYYETETTNTARYVDAASTDLLLNGLAPGTVPGDDDTHSGGGSDPGDPGGQGRGGGGGGPAPMVTTETFAKHPIYRGYQYSPPDAARYTPTPVTVAGPHAGQRFTLFEPNHPPEYYGYKTGRSPCLVYFLLSGFSTSPGAYPSSEAVIAGTEVAITEDQGYIWEFLVSGHKVFMVQLTAANAAFDGTSSQPTISGRGFFNPPGEVGRPHELLHNAKKDAVMFMQHARFYAKRYGISSIGVTGDSSGADTAAWLTFGPNYAGAYGSGGTYDMPTHPNYCILDRLGIMDWQIYAQNSALVSTQFPLAASGNAVATSLGAVAGGGAASLRYQNRASIFGYSPMIGKRCPPTLIRAGTPPTSKNIGMPLPTTNPEGTLVHTGWHAHAMRQAFKGVRLYVPITYDADADPDITDLQPFEDAAFGPQDGEFVYSDGVITNLNAHTAGDTTTALEFGQEHKDDALIFNRMDREDWIWHGQVETTGRFILHKTPNRDYALITCTDPANDLLLGPSQRQLVVKLEDTNSTGEHTYRVEGEVPLYAAAGANSSSFTIIEVMKGS